MWVGTDGGGLSCLKNGKFTNYTIEDGLPLNIILVILEDQNGNLWIGTYGGGLSRLKNGIFTNYTTQDGLPNDIILSLHKDREGSIWIGTYGGGLSRLQNGQFKNITIKEGLFNNDVFSILEDHLGNFWMSCTNGIFSARQQQLNDLCNGKIKTIKCFFYNEKDGMKSRECGGGNQPSGWRTQDGKLWFPTSKGVSYG